MYKDLQKFLTLFSVFWMLFSLLSIARGHVPSGGVLYGDMVTENRQTLGMFTGAPLSVLPLRQSLADVAEVETRYSEALDALEEIVVAHFGAISIERLANFLVPEGWEVRFDLPGSLVQQTVVFHAETTRKKALDTMLKGLNLKGTIYFRRGIVLISGG